MVQIVMMVKNSGSVIKKVIKSWQKVSKYFIILDTGSTDKTISTIKNHCKSNNLIAMIKEIPFTDFETSRNQMLRFADECQKITNEKYNLVIDDSYFFCGSVIKFKEEMKKIESVGIELCSLKIISPVGDVYLSTRICTKEHYYTGKIHEYIMPKNNGTQTILFESMWIKDTPPAQHLERTKARFLNYDIPILSKDLNSPRSMYYMACTYKNLMSIEYKENNSIVNKYTEDALNYLKQRVNMDDDDREEKFVCCMHIGDILYLMQKENDAYDYYRKGGEIYPERGGEMLYKMYLINGNKKLIKNAYEMPLKMHRLQVNTRIYEEFIPEAYRNAFS